MTNRKERHKRHKHSDPDVDALIQFGFLSQFRRTRWHNIDTQ